MLGWDAGAGRERPHGKFSGEPVALWRQACQRASETHRIAVECAFQCELWAGLCLGIVCSVHAEVWGLFVWAGPPACPHKFSAMHAPSAAAQDRARLLECCRARSRGRRNSAMTQTLRAPMREQGCSVGAANWQSLPNAKEREKSCSCLAAELPSRRAVAVWSLSLSSLVAAPQPGQRSSQRARRSVCLLSETVLAERACVFGRPVLAARCSRNIQRLQLGQLSCKLSCNSELQGAKVSCKLQW